MTAAAIMGGLPAWAVVGWVAATVVVASLGGWPVTAGILRLAKSHSVREAEIRERGGVRDSAVPRHRDQPAPTAEAAAAASGVLRGGLLIGVLERAAVVLAILAGQPVAIAYVVAIKGLGRYPELKGTPGASERFIIGTLASLLWAAAVATLARLLLL
jgi:hypothetical protein